MLENTPHIYLNANSFNLTKCSCMNGWIQNYKGLKKVYNIPIPTSFPGTCPFIDFLDTKTLRFESRLCFHLQVKCT